MAEPVVLTAERLAAFATAKPDPVQHESSPVEVRRFDLKAFLDRYGIEVKRTADWGGDGTKYILARCVWNADHDDNGAFVGQHADGRLAAACLHDSCKGRGWTEFRATFEPGYADRATTSTSEARREPMEKLRVWLPATTADLLTGTDEGVSWLAEGLLAREELAILTAPPKSLKTWTELALAVHATLGRPVLGRFPVSRPCRVLLGDEEMGTRKIRRRLQRLVRGLALGADDVAMLVENLLVFPQQGMALKSDEELRGFRAAVQDFKPDLVVLDSFAGFTAGLDDDNPTRRAFYARALAPLKEEFGLAVLLLAHPPLPTKDSHPDAQKRPRGGGDILGVADRVLYLEKLREEANEFGKVVTGSLGEYMVRELGGIESPITITVEDVANDGTVVQASGDNPASAGDLAKLNKCQVEILHRLRSDPAGRLYQPDLIRDLEAADYDKRHHYYPSVNALTTLGHVETADPIAGSGKNGKWLVLRERADD